MIDRDGLVRAMAAFRRAAGSARGRRAAVAIAVVAGAGGQPSFVLTRRAAQLRNHPGQYALPGGSLGPGESPVEAARRELGEEVGIPTSPADVVGVLDDYVTRSGFVMTPVVLWLADRSVQVVPQQAEVARVYLVPVADLGVEPHFVRIAESDSPVIRLPLLGAFIHAPTGAILHQFGEMAIHGRITRVAHYEQPVFAWK